MNKIWLLSLAILLVNSLIIPLSNISYADSNIKNESFEYIHMNDHAIWNKWEDIWYITIYSTDYSYWITLEDRNLWASDVIDPWDYYLIWDENPIDPDNLTNITFPETFETPIRVKADNDEYKWWNTETHTVNDSEDRQWICNDWYHLPSVWELEELTYLVSSSEENYIFELLTYLEIPHGWFYVRNWQNSLWKNSGLHTILTSSEYNDWGLPINASQVQNDTPTRRWRLSTSQIFWTAWGGNIRCFKNTWLETIFLNIWDETYFTQYEHGDEIEVGSLSWLVNLQEWYHIDLYVDELKETKYDSDTIDWTITLYWEIVPNTDTEYTVQHKVEPLEWEEYELIEEETLVGPTNWIATWEYKIYEWFTGLSIEDKTISWDNSTIVEVKYSRNSHNLTIDWDTTSAKYESEIILNEWTREWFHFIEWQWLPEISWDNKYYMPDYDVTITWVWEENAVTPPETPSTSSRGSGRPITNTTTKEETKAEEHNVAEEKVVEETKVEEKEIKENNIATSIREQETIEEKIEKTKERTLTRWEVAIMTNILLGVYPQLTEKKSLNEVAEACENFTDEQDFTKDEKKAITRLCKLSIMGIDNEDKTPLETFSVESDTTNNEFQLVVNRAIESYNEKDLSVVKEALKKLEWDEEWVVFGTVYSVFMSIKSIFQK